MKRTKNNKGITLVALIITIVILLILAVVSINAIQNDGILEYAENAKTSYTQGQVNEQGTLKGYLNYLGNHTVGKELIQFSIICSNDGARTYNVKPGTTFEEFVKEQNPVEDEFRGAFFWFKEDGSLATHDNGAVQVIAGNPLFFNSGTVNNGPYVYPTTIIKAGDVYNAIR